MNLITGRNNTGKSSVLEALRIHNHERRPRCDLRHTPTPRGRWRRSGRRDSFARFRDPVSGFRTFPRISAALRESLSQSLSRRTGRSGPYEDDGAARLVLGGTRLSRQSTGWYPLAHDLFGDSGGIAALVVEYQRRRDTNSPSWTDCAGISGEFAAGSGPRAVRTGSPHILHVHEPLRRRRNGNVGTSVGQNRTDRRGARMSSRRCISSPLPSPASTWFATRVYASIAYGDRTRTGDIAQPVPLRSFGDGLNRLFGIILSLVNARGGFLLIDEFENGLHYSAFSWTPGALVFRSGAVPRHTGLRNIP